MNAHAKIEVAFQRQPAAFRTLLTTESKYDAGTCGCDYATQPGELGHIEVHYDGRHSIPSVQIVLTDNEVTGLAAIDALAMALLDAAKLARRQMGIV